MSGAAWIPSVSAWLSEDCGFELAPGAALPVGGGCIHEAWRLPLQGGGSLFLKRNRAERLPMFEAEARSLDELGAAGALRVPEVHAVQVLGDSAYLAMEWLELTGARREEGLRGLGASLAALHRTTSSGGRWGAEADNFIGATPQPNGWMDSWADFYVERRLGFQFRLAADRGQGFAESDAVLELVHGRLREEEGGISPVLLHGDLWSGNTGFIASGEAVVFDPAAYYGDGEADLALTRLFGGFGPAFEEGYRESRPPAPPWRSEAYELYHLLNHFHLFGGGYRESVLATMRRLLRG